jgi:hypothetical protein
VKVFILAHQDDEIFFLPHILDTEKKLFIFLTNGVAKGSSITELDDRTLEAKLIFQNLMASQNSYVVWWGLENSISDGELHKHVSRDFIFRLSEVLLQQGVQISKFLTTAFEGAHQDHDSAAAVARKLAEKFQVEIIEMSTYPQWFSRFYSFRVLKPKSSLEIFKFDRLKVLPFVIRLMTLYKTQRVTWLGLGISILSVYALRKYRSSKPVPIQILNPCFYEFRGRAKQSEVLHCLLKI